MNVTLTPSNSTFNEDDFVAYIQCYPSIQDDWDSRIGASFNSTNTSSLTYSSMHDTIINDMIGKYNATDIEVMDLAVFVGCYMWRSGWDYSMVAFEMCNSNVLM